MRFNTLDNRGQGGVRLFAAFKTLTNLGDVFPQLRLAGLDQVIEIAGEAGLFNLFLRSLLAGLSGGLAQGTELNIERFEFFTSGRQCRRAPFKLYRSKSLLSCQSLE